MFVSTNNLIDKHIENISYWTHVFLPNHQTHYFEFNGPTMFPYSIEIQINNNQTERETYETILHDLVEHHYDYDPENNAGEVWYNSITNMRPKYSLRHLLTHFDYIDKSIGELIESIRQVINTHPNYRDYTFYDIKQERRQNKESK